MIRNMEMVKTKEWYLMVLQRILHGERLDELLRADETQPVLKAERRTQTREGS